MEDKENQMQKWHQDRQRLEKFFSFSCQQVLEVGVNLGMILEACVIKLGEFDTEFQQSFTNLEANIIPSTPLEVLEEKRRKIE